MVESGGTLPVLVVINSLGVGGAETMLVNLVNRMDRGRFQPTVISIHTKNPMAKAIRPEAADFIAVPRKWRFDLSPANEIRRIMLSRSAGAILCFGLYEFVFVRLATHGLRRRPRIALSIHGSATFRGLKGFLLYWMYARLLRGDERFISVCDAQAEYWSKTYRIPRKRFTTVYNGVDTEFFAPTGADHDRVSGRALLQIPREAFVIAMVARFHECKRHEVALAALKQLISASEIGDAPPYLLLVGSGAPEREALLHRMVADMGIQDRVIFCGDQRDVRPYLAAADLFTLTSSSEAFPVSSLEAMSLGLPVVLTDVGGVHEQILDHINGLLVPRDDVAAVAAAWARVRTQKESFDARTIRQLVVDRFSIDSCVRRYEEILADGWQRSLT